MSSSGSAPDQGGFSNPQENEVESNFRGSGEVPVYFTVGPSHQLYQHMAHGNQVQSSFFALNQVQSVGEGSSSGQNRVSRRRSATVAGIQDMQPSYRRRNYQPQGALNTSRVISSGLDISSGSNARYTGYTPGSLNAGAGNMQSISATASQTSIPHWTLTVIHDYEEETWTMSNQAYVTQTYPSNPMPTGLYQHLTTTASPTLPPTWPIAVDSETSTMQLTASFASYYLNRYYGGSSSRNPQPQYSQRSTGTLYSSQPAMHDSTSLAIYPQQSQGQSNNAGIYAIPTTQSFGVNQPMAYGTVSQYGNTNLVPAISARINPAVSYGYTYATLPISSPSYTIPATASPNYMIPAATLPSNYTFPAITSSSYTIPTMAPSSNYTFPATTSSNYAVPATITSSHMFPLVSLSNDTFPVTSGYYSYPYQTTGYTSASNYAFPPVTGDSSIVTTANSAGFYPYTPYSTVSAVYSGYGNAVFPTSSSNLGPFSSSTGSAGSSSLSSSTSAIVEQGSNVGANESTSVAGSSSSANPRWPRLRRGRMPSARISSRSGRSNEAAREAEPVRSRPARGRGSNSRGSATSNPNTENVVLNSNPVTLDASSNAVVSTASGLGFSRTAVYYTLPMMNPVSSLQSGYGHVTLPMNPNVTAMQNAILSQPIYTVASSNFIPQLGHSPGNEFMYQNPIPQQAPHSQGTGVWNGNPESELPPLPESNVVMELPPQLHGNQDPMPFPDPTDQIFPGSIAVNPGHDPINPLAPYSHQNANPGHQNFPATTAPGVPDHTTMENSLYDPVYLDLGLPIDPILRTLLNHPSFGVEGANWQQGG